MELIEIPNLSHWEFLRLFGNFDLFEIELIWIDLLELKEFIDRLFRDTFGVPYSIEKANL